MASLELSEPIAVPPEHVYAFFVPQRMPYWYGAEMDSCFEVQQGCRRGVFPLARECASPGASAAARFRTLRW